MSITAAPIAKRINHRNPKGGIPVFIVKKKKFMRPNDPTLVDVTLYRDRASAVCRLTARP
jgi:hypothetical protein